ncbi:MAG: hypothetical protein ACRD2Z_09600 [Thermoanaerobaculia bacterium]
MTRSSAARSEPERCRVCGGERDNPQTMPQGGDQGTTRYFCADPFHDPKQVAKDHRPTQSGTGAGRETAPERAPGPVERRGAYGSVTGRIQTLSSRNALRFTWEMWKELFDRLRGRDAP